MIFLVILLALGSFTSGIGQDDVNGMKTFTSGNDKDERNDQLEVESQAKGKFCIKNFRLGLTVTQLV